MAGQKKTRRSQDINGMSVGVSIPVVGTHVRPSLNDLNPNTRVLNQTLNQVPLGVIARVSSDTTTLVGTSNQYEENNYGVVENGPSAPPNTMYAEMSLDYIHREDKAMHKVISQTK